MDSSALHVLEVFEILFYILWGLCHEVVESMVFEEECEVDRTACDQGRKVFRVSQEAEIDEGRKVNRRELSSSED